MKVISFGKYQGSLRILARGIRSGDADCIAFAAKLFSAMLPERSAIIPMPSHEGRSKGMLAVAREIRRARPDISVFDCLEAEPHMSCYSQKKIGLEPCPVKMRLRSRPPSAKRKTFIIDNCACTYATAGAAWKVMPTASLMVVAVAKWRR